ncbi:uncharacterized protein [Oscarella lobularis]|uniref:uncharacterized protein n=1 Tax=Oscarella lobularis TaxID=121494 RepID=UPI003313FDC4
MSSVSLSENDPITDVAIVSKKEGCPHGYSLVHRTVGGHSAQLADKAVFGQGRRFLVITREFPLPWGNWVISDVNLHREGTPSPMTYEVISHTRNDGLPALKKVNICIKKSHREQAVSAVCDIIFVNIRKKESVPDGYVPIGELNSILVAVQYGGIPGALMKADPNAPYSLFRPFFYHGHGAPKQIDNKPASSAEHSDEDLLFSRQANGAVNPESASQKDYRDSFDRELSSLSLRARHQSIRPVSCAPVTDVAELPFVIKDRSGGLSLETILETTYLDALYIPTPEKIDAEFTYPFALERQTLFSDSSAPTEKLAAPRSKKTSVEESERKHRRKHRHAKKSRTKSTKSKGQASGRLLAI